eukprot:1147995-Pelagomonas_calceolata.AAC.11
MCSLTTNRLVILAPRRGKRKEGKKREGPQYDANHGANMVSLRPRSKAIRLQSGGAAAAHAHAHPQARVLTSSCPPMRT